MGLYLVLLGVQGAGKGEQAKFIQNTYGIPQVSTGDLFRAMRTRTDDFARKIQEIMAGGGLIDDDTTNAVVRERLALPDAAGGVILDGYPRTPAQAEWLERYLNDKGEKIAAVLLFDIDYYIAFKRAFGRVSDSSGRTYNIYYHRDGIAQDEMEAHPDKSYPPRLKVTLTNGETAIRRPDDADANAIIKRIDTFIKQTAPLIDHYSAKGLLRRIHADQPIETVSAALKALIDAAR
ncbi:MAG: nucleoside monophosphate kinase [bacterium]|nr:nucleoside monophosphate kinase [bacterium]